MEQTRMRALNFINTTNKKLNNQNCEISSIYSNKTSSSLEDSFTTLPSCSEDSFVSNNLKIKGKHYIKHSKLNRNDGDMTSLKRRVRKQQWRHEQTEVTTLQLPSTTNLILASYSQSSVTPCRYRTTKKSSCVVPLPPLILNSRSGRTRIRGIKLYMHRY